MVNFLTAFSINCKVDTEDNISVNSLILYLLFIYVLKLIYNYYLLACCTETARSSWAH